jgi:hypothetical protein
MGPTGADGLDGADGATGPAGQTTAFAEGSADWATGTNGAWISTDTQVTITSHGNDVFISATLSPWVWADFVGYRIMRDGATFISGGYMDCYNIVEEEGRYTFTITGMDVAPAAGSHTYTVQTAISDGGTNTFIVESYISVMEINE